MGNIKILELSKESALAKANELLLLEHNWKEIGDDAWTTENLIYELPLKWKLSHVAILDGKIVGYQIGSLRDGKAFLNKIVVDKSVRGNKIGTKLLAAFLKKCGMEDIKRTIFRVRTDNSAYEFYDKLGFKKEAKIDKTRKDGVESYFYDTAIKEVMGNVYNSAL